jgi:hypothetical protein
MTELETAQALFQELILKKKLYMTKIIHKNIYNIGKQKQQYLQVLYLQILTLFVKTQKNVTSTGRREK